MIRRLLKGFTYIITLQWIEDGGRFVIHALTSGRVTVRDTKSETVIRELKATRGFSAKLCVFIKAIFRFVVYTEIGVWFWFIVLFLLVLAYVIVFGPIKPVHQW